MHTDVGSYVTYKNFLNDRFDMKEEVEDVDYGKVLERLPDIKQENVEIKSEENDSGTCLQNLKDEPVDCTGTSFLTNCFNVKEEIKDICDDSAIESLSNIKCEDVEIKSEEDYIDTPLQNLKDEPVDCTDECRFEYLETTNTPKREKKPYDSRDKYRTLKQRAFFGKEMYKCNSCDYETDRKRNFTRHQHKHKDVSEKQMYKCDLCDYKTIYKSYLSQHQFRKHKDLPEEDMYKCNSCGFKTKYRNHHTQHQLKHKDIRKVQMHQCDLCDFKTKYKTNLTKHQLMKHKDISEEDMYKCDSCDFKTVYKCYLTIHQQKHQNIS